jgi:histidinol dehydrogenase
MKIFMTPPRDQWPSLLERPAIDAQQLYGTVRSVMDRVKHEGDSAVKAFTKQFDGVDIDDLKVSTQEFEQAETEVGAELKTAIQTAIANIKKFHSAQLQSIEKIETMPGVTCWRKSVGIEKVGLYIPGGSAPLFSTILMLGVPATLAGCKQIVLCSPPQKDGRMHPAILFAAKSVGITQVFKIGGVQAIAAMTYGTETVPSVYKLFGPGNQYVTCAKQLAQQEGVSIDMPAGPSEVAIFADNTANPAFVAADLLSQAEHGADSQVLLVTLANVDVQVIQKEVDRQLNDLPRIKAASGALQNSKIIVVNSEDEAMDILNAYAPEHLIVASDNAEALAEKVINAGSVFIGHYSPESVGDYASGTNHTLPTNGYARSYSGVSVDSFVKKITFQKLTKEGITSIGETVETLAAAEGLDAHRNAVTLRLNTKN